MTDPSAREAYIAAAVALFVGVVAQIVSVVNQIVNNRASARRETQKYYNEVYREFFAPLIPDVFLYVDMVTNFRRRHDATKAQEVEVKDRVIDFAKGHLQYATPQIISAYHHIRHHRLTDQRGINPSTAELAFLLALVREYEFVIRQTSPFSGAIRIDQLEPVYRRLILYLLHNSGYGSIAAYNWMFSPKVYTRKNYQKLERIIKVKNNETTKRWREMDADRKKFEESLSTMKENDRIELLNQATEARTTSYTISVTEIETWAIHKLTEAMVKNLEERRTIIEIATRADQYYSYSYDS